MTRGIALLVGAAMLAGAGLGYAAGHKNHGTIISGEDIAWAPIREGSPVSVFVLWGDPSSGAHGRLLKLPAGFTAPIHAHTGDYHGINLAGTWLHSFEETGESRELPPNSYVFQPGGEMHGDACLGTEDCIIFLTQDVAGDFIPKE